VNQQQLKSQFKAISEQMHKHKNIYWNSKGWQIFSCPVQP